MRIAVFGIGGVGGIVGGALARVCPDVSLVARGRALEAIRRDGLIVESALLGSFTVRPRALDSSALEGAGPMDAVVVACKGYDIEAACRAISPLLRADTLVVPLLNGLGASDVMEPLLPPCVLAGGLIYVFSHLEGPGRVAHTSGPCRVIMGMRDGSRSAALEDLSALMAEAGLDARTTGDILSEQWRKYATVGSMNIMCCLWDGPVGKAREDPGHEAVLRGTLDEIRAVAEAQGASLPGEMEEEIVARFEASPPDTITSLYRDLSAGKPPERTELRWLIGRVVEMACAAGVSVPHHEEALARWAEH